MANEQIQTWGRTVRRLCGVAALSTAFLILAPLVAPAPERGDGFFSARADGDDGGGGGPGAAAGPGGDGGPGGAGPDAGGGVIRGADRRRRQNCFLFFCEPRRAQRPQRRVARAGARPPRAAAAAPPVRRAPAEFVVFGARPGQDQAIEQARFAIVARAPLGAGRGEVLRLRAPSGMSRQRALRTLAEAAPGAAAARNDIFRSFLPSAGRANRAPARLLSPSLACAAGASVAMIDTAVDMAHPALGGAAIRQIDMRGADRRPSSTRHGTAIASLLVGASAGPAPGVAPAASLIAIDAFHRDGAGADVADTFDLVRALDAVSGVEARIVNLSLAGPANPALQRAIEALQAEGRIIVAAAGNEGPRARPLYPAAYPGVIAVAAVDGRGRPWRWSARGAHIAFAAEGVDLGLAGRDGGAEAYTGTSFAAPLVAAMLAVKARHDGALDAPALKARLASLAEDVGDPGRDPVYGHGLVRPGEACRAVAERR